MKNTVKKKHSILKISVICLLIALISTIIFYIYHPKKAIGFAFPDLNKINGLNILIKNDSAYTNISMVLENKNPYKLHIDSLDFQLSLDTSHIASQKINLGINQRGFDIDTVSIPLYLDINKIKNTIKSLQNTDSTNVYIKGYITYNTFLGKLKINLDQHKTIATPVPPQIKVTKIKRNKFNLIKNTLKLDLLVEIINKGKNLDLKLEDIHYNITIKNNIESKGIIKKTIVIKPKSTFTVEVPIELKIHHTLKTIFKMVTDKDSLDYKLNIKCNTEENITSKSFSSPTEITILGKLPPVDK